MPDNRLKIKKRFKMLNDEVYSRKAKDWVWIKEFGNWLARNNKGKRDIESEMREIDD